MERWELTRSTLDAALGRRSRGDRRGEPQLRRPGWSAGGHLMAGSERTGVEHAKADLFECANYVAHAHLKHER